MSKLNDMLRRLGSREHGDPNGPPTGQELGRSLIWLEQAADACETQEGEVAYRVLFLAVAELLERRR